MFSVATMDDDNWDLSAVVRSCRPSGAAATMDPFSSFPPPSGPLLAAEGDKGGAFVLFPDVFESRTGVLELEELHSSSFPKGQPFLQQQGSSWSHRPAATAALAATPVAGSCQPSPRQKADRTASQTPRSRRRKNQQKKVVRLVPADELSSDVWAWRKYGQKPIKGSPYPRGYYRCSSSKGCPARKQVERSRTDPATFIVTYTAEHNHPVPTHRSSLAGSTRNKFPSPPSASAAAADGSDHQPIGNPEASPLSSTTAAELSPTTPLSASILSRSKKGEHGKDGVDEEEEMEEEDDEGELLVQDMEMMGEEDLFFVSSEEGGAAASATAAEMAAFFEGDGGFEDHLFPLPFLSN